MDKILDVILKAPTSLYSRAKMTRNGEVWVFTPPPRKTGTKTIQPKCSPAMSNLEILINQCPSPMVIPKKLTVSTKCDILCLCHSLSVTVFYMKTCSHMMSVTVRQMLAFCCHRVIFQPVWVTVSNCFYVWCLFEINVAWRLFGICVYGKLETTLKSDIHTKCSIFHFSINTRGNLYYSNKQKENRFT